MAALTATSPGSPPRASCPGQCLARPGPSLDPLGTGPVRDAPGGRRPAHLGHVRLPGRHRRAHRSTCSSPIARARTRPWAPGRRCRHSSTSFTPSSAPGRSTSSSWPSASTMPARFELLGELIRREIRCIDPLRLLAAYPTRRTGRRRGAATSRRWSTPRNFPGSTNWTPTPAARLFARDVGLIYDFAEAAEAGLAAAREQLERWDERSPRTRSWPGPTSTCWSTPTRPATRPAPPREAILDDLVPGLRVNRRELDLARERLLRPLNQSLQRGGRSPGLDLCRRDLCVFRQPRVCGDGYLVREGQGVGAAPGPALVARRIPPRRIAPGTLHPNRRGHQVIADRLFQSLAARR